MARILIIDDDLDVRLMMRAVLEEAGYDVVEAKDGVQGTRAQNTDPVLCDIFMPRMDGLETIRLLRGRHPATPIIAMTAGSDAVRVDFLAAPQHLGAVMVLRKPLDLHPERLRRVVAAALRRAQ